MTTVRLRLALAGLAVASTLSTLALMSGPASASIAGSATLKLSGAGHGALHEGASGICTTAHGQGVDILGLVGSVSGFKTASSWTITVESSSTKAGTFTIGTNDASGQLDPLAKHPTVLSSEKAILNATKGSYTDKGNKGSLNVTFGSGKKAITVKGSWDC